MYCFSSDKEKAECKECALRYSGQGNIMCKYLPEVEEYKQQLGITFKEKILAKDFAKYFGSIQKALLDETYKEIVVNISEVTYLNHFCISKILLSLYSIRMEKAIKIIFPRQFNSNKMMRYLYNLGILDFIFSVEEFQCYAGQDKIVHYNDKWYFGECYDAAIFPYTIFDEDIMDDNINRIEQIIETVLIEINKFYATRNQDEQFRQIESRIRLYLFEIIDNIFKHAYLQLGKEKALFAINIYNSYLPPYRVLVGTPEERKFEERINRLQNEVPMSVYRDIHDRYFGGFNIFIDDIGCGIENSYKRSNKENIYKDVYLNGSKKRATINGLKLVADQIAINCDLLWAHDGRTWISTSFSETGNICKSDESRTKWYEHTSIYGLTYDLFINLAKNSKEKRKAYEEYGQKITFSIEDIRNMVTNNVEELSIQSLFVDLLNITLKNKSYSKVLGSPCDVIYYRPRAMQKNMMEKEIKNRVINKLSDKSHVKQLVVYDLNQTTLFQIKAVFENKEVAVPLIKCGIRKIVLLTEEGWVFIMDILDDSFYMIKSNRQENLKSNEIRQFFIDIIRNDAVTLKDVFDHCDNDFIYNGKIFWGFQEINQYIDIENMLSDRAISDIIRKSITRISGMLDENQKIIFMEKFMERNYGTLVNEYKNNIVQNVYFGSIIMSGETEKRIAGENDIKIYLFKHKECNVRTDDKHIILFSEIQSRGKGEKGNFRRVLNTNRIECCSSKKSEEYSYYESSAYKNNIRRIDYVIGLFSTGFFRIKKNEALFEGYVRFALGILKIEMRKFDSIHIRIEEGFLEQKNRQCLKEEIEKIIKGDEFRNRDKKVFFDNNQNINADLVVIMNETIDYVDMMINLKYSKTEIIFLPLFAKEQFNANFDKILEAGYMPYLPILYSENKCLVSDGKLEKFYSFIRTLNPGYRKELENVINKQSSLQIPYDFTLDILSFLDHLFGSSDKIDILGDIVSQNIRGVLGETIKTSISEGQYKVLVNSFLLHHSVSKLDSEYKNEIINSILSFFAKYNNDIENSIITYIIFIILKSVTIEKKLQESLFSKELGKKLLHSKSTHLRILFADLYNENSRLKFQTELNEFFVSNDITIYYNMLAHLLFNVHGTIHDSKLDAIYKKLVENIDSITEEDIKNIENIVPNCIALLKLTKSYDDSLESIEELEQEFMSYNKDTSANLQEIKILLEKITTHVKSRFEIIEKEYVGEGIANIYIKILDVLKKKRININDDDISNLNIIIGEDCEVGKDCLIKRNMNLYKDTIIYEELAYLVHNALTHSKERFSLNGNSDKKYKVWVKAEIHSNYIYFRFFNSIERGENNFDNIVNAIQEKKRIGKTYLEKFNIHVRYFHNPKGIMDIDFDMDIIETCIELPYFN